MRGEAFASLRLEGADHLDCSDVGLILDALGRRKFSFGVPIGERVESMLQISIRAQFKELSESIRRETAGDWLKKPAKSRSYFSFYHACSLPQNPVFGGVADSAGSSSASMIVKLHERGLITRLPWQAHSIKLLINPDELPGLKRP